MTRYVFSLSPIQRTKGNIMADRQTQLLRTAFLVGAITDALAVVPMLSPAVAYLVMGFEDVSDPYRFAMGYAA